MFVLVDFEYFYFALNNRNTFKYYVNTRALLSRTYKINAVHNATLINW